MAVQEGGWPLGLRPLNVRIGQVRNMDLSRSMSFNTLITGSPSSSTDSSSSDIDTESTGSFFHERGITLGRLIGRTSSLEFTGGSLSGRRQRQDSTSRRESSRRPRAWFFSLCARTAASRRTAGSPVASAPSLGHFLARERRAKYAARRFLRSQIPVTYEHFGLPESRHAAEQPEFNSLFSGGCVAPPPPVQLLEPHEGTRSGDPCRHSNGCGNRFRLPCMGGRSP